MHTERRNANFILFVLILVLPTIICQVRLSFLIYKTSPLNSTTNSYCKTSICHIRAKKCLNKEFNSAKRIVKKVRASFIVSNSQHIEMYAGQCEYKQKQYCCCTTKVCYFFMFVSTFNFSFILIIVDVFNNSVRFLSRFNR